MQMDNLAYNHSKHVLVANELKLGGKKNKDQLLKYAFMKLKLEDIGFIACDTTFQLLFIGDKHECFDLAEEIDREIEYCQTPKGKYLLDDRILNFAKTMNVASMTWSEMITFNEEYISQIDPKRQVEIKLLSGFNTTLREKAFLQI